MRKMTVWRGMLISAVAAACTALASGSAAAQTSGPTFEFAPLVLNQTPGRIIDEVTVGALAHDVTLFGKHVESGSDINLEVLFLPPDFLSVIGSPRPMIGGDINTSGNTSSGYLGLTWGISFIHDLLISGDSIFATAGLGGAVQDGYELTAPLGRKRLGSPVLFHLSIELGYQFTPTINIALFIDHMSNANLAPRNAGITNLGVRLGFRF
jgi:lipid A 3-O-deacylase